MADSVPLQIAETIQTASVQHNPSVERDLAPSTAADTKIPVVIEKRHRDVDDDDDNNDPLGLDDDLCEIDGDDEDNDDSDQNYSVIRPWDPAVDGRRYRGGDKDRSSHSHHYALPPLPDLRFEQSYLRSISAATAQGAWWKVALITVRDQVMFPFLQGLVYNVGICGWQAYNRRATLNGQSVGARVRRWWYGVNNWPIPGQRSGGCKYRHK